MKIIFLFINLMLICATWAEEITPFKYSEKLPTYDIPPSSRFTVKRLETESPDVIYYFTAPQSDRYPIAILCCGSSTAQVVSSIIHFHRYLLQEFLDLKIGVITLEQRGVDGLEVDVNEFLDHYTRLNRLKDHQAVIEYLKENPPKGWNGKFIFLGVSEGGPIVTSLSAQYSDNLIATINWCGAGEWAWREELWNFIKNLNPTINPIECEICHEHLISRELYDAIMDSINLNPTPDQSFLGMTYKYHADAMTYPKVEYENICTPYLVVVGVKDAIIDSCDAFVEKAELASMKITYLRIEDMDHYVRKRPDVISQSFAWLKNEVQSIK